MQLFVLSYSPEINFEIIRQKWIFEYTSNYSMATFQLILECVVNIVRNVLSQAAKPHQYIFLSGKSAGPLGSTGTTRGGGGGGGAHKHPVEGSGRNDDKGMQ